MTSLLPLRTANLSSIVPQQNAGAATTAGVQNTSALYPSDLLSKAGSAFTDRLQLQASSNILVNSNRQQIVDQLNTADAYAGLASLCMKEGDFTRAQEYLNDAASIRNSVKPSLTASQQSTLDQITNLQQQALQSFMAGNSLQGQQNLDQATQLSQNLKSSILYPYRAVFSAQQLLA
jgi:tetratricopeptide (TPR) repeat protein